MTCSSEIGYMIYRSTTMLFQMLFEYRYIAHLPREDFLPTQTEYNFTKGSKLGRVSRYLFCQYFIVSYFLIDRNVEYPVAFSMPNTRCVIV